MSRNKWILADKKITRVLKVFDTRPDAESAMKSNQVLLIAKPTGPTVYDNNVGYVFINQSKMEPESSIQKKSMDALDDVPNWTYNRARKERLAEFDLFHPGTKVKKPDFSVRAIMREEKGE